MSQETIVIINSGGLDSSTLMYYAKENGYKIISLSFDYGQRHVKELECAKEIAELCGAEWHKIDMSFLGPLFASQGSASSLVSGNDVPDGHYAEDTMKQTVVPNRNMIMLSIAAGVAVASGASGVWTGVHAGDHFIYPDCRPQFIAALNAAMVYGNEGFGTIPEIPQGTVPINFLQAPFLHNTKADIASMALLFAVPLEKTWSCYKGGDMHCGRCGTCVERLEAIDEAIRRLSDLQLHDLEPFVDGTPYADIDYWKTVTKEA